MVKIIIVRPPLQQSSINVLKPWAPTHQEIYTNSELLAKIRPNTKKVEEPSIDQLKRAQETHDVVFVYPSIERLKREASLLSELPGEKKVIVFIQNTNSRQSFNNTKWCHIENISTTVGGFYFGTKTCWFIR